MSTNTEKTNLSNAEPDPDKEAIPLLKECQERWNASTKKWEDPFKEIRRIRRFVAGRTNKRLETGVDTRDQSRVQDQQANIAYSTLQTLLPLLYARDPDLTAKPSPNVNPQTDSYKQAGQFAETIEIVASRAVREADIKKIAKQAIRNAQIDSVAMVKVGYQTDYYRDPLINDRIEDLQEKLAQLRGSAQQMDDDDIDEEEAEATKEHMNDQIEALQAKVEVVRAEGLVIDPFPIEDFRLDPQLDSLERYRDAGWMGMCSWMTRKDVRDQFALEDEELNEINVYKRNISGIPERMGHKNASGADQTDDISNRPEVLPIMELWDRTSNTVYTWGEGSKDWLREPFRPERMGKRWYPFFLLAFNWRDSTEEWPISEAALLENLCREYDVIRKQAYEHRKLCKPTYVTDASRVADQKDIKKYSVADIGEIVAVNAAGTPIDDFIRPAIHPPFNPQIYDTTSVLADIDRVSGVGDAQRGSVQRAKTATEANIQQGGLTGRMDEKRDQLEDWLTDIYRFSAEMLIQSMSIQEVHRLAGPDAFWPQVSKEELYTMVEIEVRAGSTGKPDKEQELQTWTQILPMITENTQQIMQMRGQGVPDKENIYIQILMETLRRVDDRIDLEKFLPGEPVEGDPRPELGQIGPSGPDIGEQQGGANGADQQAQMDEQMAREGAQAEMQAEHGGDAHEMQMMQQEQAGEMAAAGEDRKAMSEEQKMRHAEESHAMKMRQGQHSMDAKDRAARSKPN